MAVLCVMLLAVCLIDYRSTRIPNWLIWLIFLYGLGWHYRDAGGGGLTEALLNCLLVLILLYPLFKVGAVGAGDVKLYSVTAGCLSGQVVPCFLIYSLLIAAIISLLKMILVRNAKERFYYLCMYLVDICRNGRFQLYFENETNKRKASICLSGPIFLSVLLGLGGVY